MVHVGHEHDPQLRSVTQGPYSPDTCGGTSDDIGAAGGRGVCGRRVGQDCGSGARRVETGHDGRELDKRKRQTTRLEPAAVTLKLQLYDTALFID